MEFKVGDIVTLDHNATIEDLVRDYWNGCQLATLAFIRDNANGQNHEVVGFSDYGSGNVKFSNGLIVNKNVLKLVERPDKKNYD